MSSEEDERNGSGYSGNNTEQAADGVVNIGAKKRKLQRACDICRRRKGMTGFNMVQTRL